MSPATSAPERRWSSFVRPIPSTPPAQDHHAAPEQVLVELLVETETLGLMDTAEARAALVAATDSGWIKMSDLKRFAEFRQLEWQKIFPIN
ncbi:MAG: hypothetical protein LBG65_00570 [Puniceicoccales bacterium]|nr:hypothetical protein [Puniceicoccales bacterium]